MDKNKHITIIGAGLAGAYLGLLLGKQGYAIEIYEYRSESAQNSYSEGRSYSITLYYRAIQALKKIGIWEKVKDAAVRIDGDITHILGKNTTYDPIEESGKAVLYAIHRTTLISILLKELKKLKNVRVSFNTRLLTVDKWKKLVYLQNTQTKKILSLKTECVIGADGINSVVRSELQRGIHSSAVQEYFNWGYKETYISPKKAKLLNLPPNTMHHWPAKKTLLIGFPNIDNSFTFMFNLPLSGNDGFESLRTKEQIKNYLITNFPDLSPNSDAIARDFLNNPIGKFVTIYCDPWSWEGFLLLIGDAAHGVIPFYGQGACAAFEDCLILSECLQQNTDRKIAFEQFFTIRKRNTDVLAYLSKQNFVELRNKSNKIYYSLRNTTDTLLNRLLPNFWSPPLCRRIAHDDDPYADAYARFTRQRRITKYSGIDAYLQLLAMGISIALKGKQAAKIIARKIKININIL